MSKSKGHIESIIAKVAKSAKSDRELFVKGLTFGSWWNDAGEYEKAAHWITKYLTVYDKDARAHKMLGEVYERLEKTDNALNCYKNSLRVKQDQPDLLLKVAEMHVNPGPTQNAARAQVWLDKAAASLPNNPQIYRLKMELLFAQDALPMKLEEAMVAELKKRPVDPSLYVEYVTFLKNQDRLPEAFAFALKTDRSSNLTESVEKDLEWIQCIIDTCLDYIDKTCNNVVTAECIKAYSLLLISICRNVWIHFEQEHYNEAMENLAMLDVKLLSALSLDNESIETESRAWKALLNESKGQLYWLCGLALIHLATKDEISWDEATKLAAACYARSLSVPIADVSDTWADRSSVDTGVDRLKIMGGFRLSQCSHMLYNLAETSHSQYKEENDVNEIEWLEDINRNFCTKEGQRKIFQTLFGVNYESERSMVYTDGEFDDAVAVLVTEEDLTRYDTSAILSLDLQTWIWIGVQWRQNLGNSMDPFSWVSNVFHDLPLALSSSVKYGNIWNLCQLDVEAFMVACVLYAEKGVAIWKNVTPHSGKNFLGTGALPLPLCKKFVTSKQIEWWSTACRLHCHHSKEKIYNANQVKAILRRGIEALRVSGNHGLQLALITGLANHFSAKAYAIDKSGFGTSSNVWLAYQRRAAHYWTTAQPLLTDIIHKRVKHKTEALDRLFPATLPDPTIEEASSLLSEVYMCNGSLLVQEADLKKALETYAKADTPHASFSEALIYKQLLDNLEKEEPPLVGSSSKRKELLTRKYTARLEVTLNRLEQMPDEELLRRTEAMLHNHLEKYPSFKDEQQPQPRKLFNETIPKQFHDNTVISEVDESSLPGPSKQSTPKSEPTDERVQVDVAAVSKFAQSLSAITSHLSTMQINFNERLNKVEETNSPKPKKDEDSQDLRALLQTLTDKVDSIQEQVSKSQQGTPVAAAHDPATYPGYDQYQQSPYAMASPMQMNNQLYMQGYNTYLRSQSPHGGVGLNVAPGLPPPMYPGTTRVPDPRSLMSPVGTPPIPIRSQLSHPGLSMPMGVPSPAGTPPMHMRPAHPHPNQSLPMSKEAANALSARFQSGLLSGPLRPMSPVQGQFSQPSTPPVPQGGSVPSLQGRAQGDSAFSNQPGIFTSNIRATLPVARDTMTQPDGGLASEPANKPTQEPGLQYPSHIQFPMDNKAGSGGSGWNFKFQTPEEMDKDNRKLEEDEQADDADTSQNDAGPHFEPIVTLEEVEVVTGEEDESEMFGERAKLFRYVDEQWKERGVGMMKILKHKETGRNRLLMRRDQIHKICCNHLIGKELKLSLMKNSDKAWMWNAIDFSEGRSQETFAVRFKDAEIANDFRDKFIQGQKENIALGSPSKSSGNNTPAQTSTVDKNSPVVSSSPAASVAPAVKPTLFGATSPKFTMAQPSPFALMLASRMGGTSQNQETVKDQEEGESDGEDVHNQSVDGPHFEPVIPLPEKVETKTGEEDEEVLFQYRAKLFRFVDKQWKERGLGDIKILHNKKTQKCRIVMRREQVLKLCANHNITQEMNLTPMSNSDRVWTWVAYDHSELESPPQLEKLAVRFKLTETAADFKKFFDQAKEIIAGKNQTTPLGKSEISQHKEGPSVAQPTTTNVNIPKNDQAQSTQPSSGLFSLSKAQPAAPIKFGFGTSSATGSTTSSTPQTSMKYSFGTSSSTSTGFSFGGKPADGASTSSPSTFSFGVKAANPPAFGGSTTSSTFANASSNQSNTPAAPLFGGTSSGTSARASTKSQPKETTLNQPQFSTSGPLVSQKAAGQWSCDGCYTDNDASDALCVCCQSPNPNAPAAPQGNANTAKGGIFGSGTNQKQTYSFGISGNTGSTQASQAAPASGGNTRPSIFGSASTNQSSTPATSNQPQSGSSGPLVAQKAAGQWSCDGCYADNDASDALCVCCQSPNPNAPAAPQGNANTAQGGIFGSGTNQQQTYSFGFSSNIGSIQASQAAVMGKPVIPPMTVSFGNPGSVAVGGQGGQSNSIFGGAPSSGNIFGNLGLPKPNIPGTASYQKPSFPSVGDEENESEDEEDSDEYTTTSDSVTDTDEEVNSHQYRSPMNRPTEEVEQKDDDDVICLGEVLPSDELQKKAAELMLPKHFYNYVKPGENVDDSSTTETEDETVKKDEPQSQRQEQPTASQNTASSGFTFGSVTSGATSFGDLASKTADGGFAFGKSTGGWIGMGQQKPLFANLRDDSEKDGDDSYTHEENVDVHFEPVIKLPDEVTTVTGEEDEVVVHSQRCKLYRYNKPTNEWKERGLGDMKILQHKTTNKMRIVMRREQVLKVCANHYVTPDMTLEPSKSSDKAWTWSALDYSEEGGPKHEIFTARFKNKKAADEFKNNFDVNKAMLLDLHGSNPSLSGSSKSKELNEKAEKMKNELQFFKDKFGALSKYDLNRTLTDESRTPQRPIAKGSLTPLVAEHVSQKEQANAKIATSANRSEPLHKPKSLFSDDKGFTFAIKKSQAGDDDRTARSRKHTESTGSDDPQAENSDIHFEPIVPLPDKIELITGEEDEQVLFANRCKLFGYHQATKQWKERGIGDIKILQHTGTAKIRVIMRREQVFKLCLNHLIQAGLTLHYKEENAKKTLMWAATDFSDPEKPDGEPMQFAVRFKSAEIAASFKDTWEEGEAAVESGTLVEPDAEKINLSIASIGATSPGPARAQSPVSPVKPSTSVFSFANVPSPFAATKSSQAGPVKVGGFVFGEPDSTVTSTPSDPKFKFDAKKLSFAFGVQPKSTQPGGGFFTPLTQTPQKPQNDVDAAHGDSLASVLYVTAAESPRETTDNKPKTTGFNFGGGQGFATSGTAQGYKPSPLVTNENTRDEGSTSNQGGSRSLFIPPMSEPIQPSQVSENEEADVIFVAEILPRKEFVKKAEDLKLPKAFFLFDDSENQDFDDELFDAEEDRVFKFLEDRDSGKLPRNTPEKSHNMPGNQPTESNSPSHKNNTSQNNASTIPSFASLSQSKSTTENVFGSVSGGLTFGDVSNGAASFSNLASNVQSVGFKKDPNFRFPGAGQIMFQNQDEVNDTEEQDPTKYQCQAEFKPVLNELPALVDVKTGEEGEEVIFKERCKLFRYDQEGKAWKERGVGEIKLLRNDTHKLYRAVMRRDQVLKVCTNHVIGEKTDPQYHLGNMKTCTYFIMDYTDGKEPKPEQVAIRFKTEDICKNYMNSIADIKADPGFS